MPKEFHLKFQVQKQPPEVFLEISQVSLENTCARVSFLMKFQAETCNFIKRETLTQVFSFEFCEISKNTFFIEALRATASELNYYFIMSNVTNFHKYYRGEVTREEKIMNHYIKFSISGCISGTEYVFFTFNLTFTLNFSTSSFSLVIFS